MSGKRKGIAVAGSLIAEGVYTTDTYPSAGFLANVLDKKQNVGGCGNLILDLAKMDPELSVEVCAVIGEDNEGKMILETLREYPNISLDHVTCMGKSSITHVIDPEDTKQRTFFFQAESSDCFEEKYIHWDTVSCEIFVLEYLLLMKKVDAVDAEYGTHGARILHEAQKRGMKTAIDMVSEQGERARSVVVPALKYTNYCVINELEAEAITSISLTDESVEKVLKTIREMGVADWIVVHTSSGAYGMECGKEQLIYVPSLSLPDGFIRGNTGAGDAFCSGILYGVYSGMDLATAMRYAAAAAACSLSEQNGTDGLRGAAEIWQLESEMRKRNCEGQYGEAQQ